MTKIKSNILSVSLIIGGLLFLQYLFIDNSKFVFFQIGLVFILILIVFSIYTKSSLHLFIIILAILPFMYINKGFSRSYSSIILQDIPLFFLMLFALFSWIKNAKNYIIKIDFLFLPIVFYLIFSVWLAIYGTLQGNHRSIILVELYQAFYLILVFPVYSLIKSRKEYLVIFGILTLVFAMVSIEYIILNHSSTMRVTTYHNHIFPIFVSIFFASLFFLKNNYLKLFALLLLLLFWYGSFATGTRTLLVVNLFSMIVVYLFYLISRGRKIRYILIVLAVGILLLMPSIYSMVKSNTELKRTTGEERLESISNPLAEVSLLMRVEAVYHMSKQIAKKPILGYGFGHMLQMEYLLQTAFIFPDNNYLYYWLKGGIFYLLIVIWMFYRLLSVIYRLFVSSNSANNKVLMSGLFAGISGLLIFALLNANLVKLRLNFVYVIIFAFVNYEYHKFRKKTKE
jgi:O-antigen ligase